MRQMSTCKVVVTSPEGYEIGEIYAALTLIDFGPTSALCDHHSNKSSISCYNEVRSYVPNFNVPLLRQNGLTQDELLQAALELELCKRGKENFSELRLSVRELEQKNGSLMKKVKELEKELQEQRIAADNLKSQANKDPDVQLRTEVNILNMEKAELQQKLETALASKQKYKYQWSQAVRQIGALQQKLHMMECLEKEKKEKLASFQQRMLSAEEKNAIQTNEDILDMVNEKVQG
ncbi:centrosomal protein [Trichonephila clavata]|uniref:Centrosomal protein n=1 Tax=Trichonephila clavata TaxID=2740835 RepID=A0A8X6K7J7_TRICU|nr:centrosomal protein [Trichonephila clavata]